MRARKNLWVALLLLAFFPALAHAQQTGKIQGHVNDEAGAALANLQVVLSLDGKTAKYTFQTDQNGDYTGDNIAPNTYVVTLYQGPTKAIDRFENVKIAGGASVTQNFDLSRPDYIAKLSPEERKQIEQTKQKNSQIVKENQVVGKLNDQLKQAREDNKDKKYDDAATLMTQATQTKPDAAVLWVELGIAQVGQKKYDDAITSLKKALDLDNASGKPNQELQAAVQNSLGEAYAATQKIPDAQAAYDAAARLQPQNAGMYYTNEAIVLSRAGQGDATAAACDKAIAANPNDAIAYYLKGQALIQKATLDPKTHKIVPPPGTVDAYQKYLQLAPNGPFAPQVQQMLTELGEKINSRYSAKGK
jgi:tetratricopeptide (TPR) repeat protein